MKMAKSRMISQKQKVTPFAGVWIEIDDRHWRDVGVSGHPLRGGVD